MTCEAYAPARHGLRPDKIASRHRERLAIVYVRQSTPQQIERHQESTRLQYALVDRAVEFGWDRERVLVIDDDLGRSGSTIEGRLGFQRLVAQVGLGKVGLVLGIEMSRLARSCRDWHQLLEICALFDTLIADADGVYDPAHYNDRLLLGLKGTMSEAELHVLKARMLEGRMAKAERGELGKAVPMGYVRRTSGEIVLDPDEQAQGTIRLVFDLYGRHRTIGRVLRHLAANDIRLPVRARSGAAKGELEWHRPNRPSLYGLLVNPLYAGAYVYGLRPTDRRRQRPGHPRTGRRPPDLENARVVLRDRVPAYISWQQYLENQAQLRANATRRKGPVRAGAALLSGLLICGRCGLRMTSAYNHNGRGPRYVCGNMRSTYDEPLCQSVAAPPLDRLVADLVLDAVQPATLELSLAVAADVEAERAAAERHWQHRLERARYRIERARRQYDAVEPENRLVARTLERAWEEALAEHARLEGEHERIMRERPPAPSAEELAAIRALAEDLPALWRADTTTQEDRQTLVRLLVERLVVEVIGDSEQVRVDCHWQGGGRTQHWIVRPISSSKRLSTYAALIARASELRRAGHDGSEIAAILNREGWRPAKRTDAFTGSMVRHLLRETEAEPSPSRLRSPALDRGPDEWTVPELALRLGIPASTVYGWVRRGRLRSRALGAASRPNRLVYADAATIAMLMARHCPPSALMNLESHHG
jgi:DNA invertase Pin-like site-specific DNA recombinase